MKAMKKQVIITSILIILLLLVGAFGTYMYVKRSQYNNSAAALTLGTGDSTEYTSLTGESISLSTFEGSVRVGNSWASWSPLSKTELTELERLGAAYKDRGVVIIAINRNEDAVRAQRYLEQLGTLQHINFLMDGDDAFYARMDGKAMPETLYFDRSGNIIAHVRGDASYDEMVTHVEAALAAQ